MKEIKKKKGKRRWTRDDTDLTLISLPTFIWFVLFSYLPMFGIIIAFKDYKLSPGHGFIYNLLHSDWVGWSNFTYFFKSNAFWMLLRNTIVYNLVFIALGAAVAVGFALMLSNLRNKLASKAYQTMMFFPYFMSWVVTASVFTLILSPGDAGLVNSILIKLGIIDEGIYFLGDKEWWRSMFYAINIWKDTGWGTIIFMATLSGINPELYEAASMDGANRWNQIRYITLPALANTIITVLILNLAKVMNLFESVFVLQNDAVIQKADVLQTYIYTQTFNSGALPDFGYTTAVSVTASVVGCILVLLCNRASYKVRGRGIV